MVGYINPVKPEVRGQKKSFYTISLVDISVKGEKRKIPLWQIFIICSVQVSIFQVLIFESKTFLFPLAPLFIVKVNICALEKKRVDYNTAGCTYINITQVLITKAVNTEYRTVHEAFLTFSDMLPSLLRC